MSSYLALALPVAECMEEIVSRVAGDIFLGERAEQVNRAPKLFKVAPAAAAAAKVRLEACAIRRGNRALEIVRHQLDEFLTT